MKENKLLIVLLAVILLPSLSAVTLNQNTVLMSNATNINFTVDVTSVTGTLFNVTNTGIYITGLGCTSPRTLDSGVSTIDLTLVTNNTNNLASTYCELRTGLGNPTNPFYTGFTFLVAMASVITLLMISAVVFLMFKGKYDVHTLVLNLVKALIGIWLLAIFLAAIQ